MLVLVGLSAHHYYRLLLGEKSRENYLCKRTFQISIL